MEEKDEDDRTEEDEKDWKRRTKTIGRGGQRQSEEG